MIITQKTDINETNLSNWIKQFVNDPTEQPRLIKLGKYYDNLNPITKKGAVKGRPNYSVHVNLASYITDVQTGYFIGKPIDYDWKEKIDDSGNVTEINPFKEQLTEILTNNYEEEENFTLASDMSCYGVAYEIVMVNEGKIYFSKLDAENTFFVYDNTILNKPICAVYLYTVYDENQTWTEGYVYTAEVVRHFSLKGALTFDEEDVNPFGAIPVIKFKNNFDEKGDYEQVLEQLDALALTISNETDDLQSIANAILAIYGAMGTTEENIDNISRTKVAKLPTDSKMEFVVKNINIEAVKHQIDQNLDLVYQISNTPDLSDDSFGGQQSGVAMQYKLWGLEQRRLTKVRYFRKALFERLKLILHILNILSPTDEIYDISQKVDFIFYSNLPHNESEIADMVVKLQGIVSQRTLLQQLCFVQDIPEEIRLVNEEQKAKAEQEASAFNSYGEGIKKDTQTEE